MTEPMVPSIIADIGRFNTEEVSFSRGRQEDAHEFWMALSDELLRIYPPFARSFSFELE